MLIHTYILKHTYPSIKQLDEFDTKNPNPTLYILWVFEINMQHVQQKRKISTLKN